MVRSLADRIAELAALPSCELKERWAAAFGSPPPPRTSRDLMIRALGHWIQEQAEGGLDKATRRRLDRLAGDGIDAAARAPLPRLKPGTRLVREWQGTVHQVTVLDQGFEHRGGHYGSLSSIARAITGTRWSGPAFFGLRARRAVRIKGNADGG